MFNKSNKFSLVIAFLTLLITSQSNGQAWQVERQYINLGAGIGSPYYVYATKVTMIPLQLSYEYAIDDNLGFGAIVGYASSYRTFPFIVYYPRALPLKASITWQYYYIPIGIRGCYHFLEKNKFLDLYGGVMFDDVITGANFESTDNVTQSQAGVKNPGKSGLTFGVYVGARCMLSNRFGVFAEAGYSISYFTLGVTGKL